VEDLLDVCDAYLDDDSNVSSEDIVVRLHFYSHFIFKSFSLTD